MPTGPHGEKRPSNPIEAGVHIGRLATGEAEEQYVNLAKQEGGRKGGQTRAKNMAPEERSRIARQAAKARWHPD
ncbi:MAG: hypothetical protein OXJ90_22170 [Spirochaetaceae bacterium]|nr:hypothetical protein [Spirochaetaceae bacterium]